MRKNKGITLIALIVTIIVLLILAGVSLSLIAGGDGVINKASKSADTHYAASAKEQTEMRFAEYMSEFYDKKYYTNEINANIKFGDWVYATYGGENNSQTVGDYEFTVTENPDTDAVTYLVKIETNDKLNSEETALLTQDGVLTWDNIQPTILTAIYSINKIIDAQRSPAFPGEGDSVRIWNFVKPYRKNGTVVTNLSSGNYLKFTNLGTISTLTDQGLKNNLQSNYPNQDYPVVRLDEYNENGEFQGEFSQGGILYLLSEERGIYLFVASRYDSNNSYGYIICLTEEEADTLKAEGSATLTAGGIVEDIN